MHGHTNIFERERERELTLKPLIFCLLACCFNLLTLNLCCMNDKLILLLQIIRLLANHPNFDITLMTADRKAGQSIGSVFPHLIAQVQVLILLWFLLSLIPHILSSYSTCGQICYVAVCNCINVSTMKFFLFRSIYCMTLFSM